VSDDLYHARLVELARAAYGHGALAPPRRFATRDNPLCGDQVTVEVRLAGGAVAAVAHRVKGCLLCQAAASAIGHYAPGAAVADVRAVAAQLRRMLREDGALPEGLWPELAAFAPVRAYKSRHTCVLLPFEALLDAVAGQNPWEEVILLP